jgi:hypothetical protein
MCSSPPPFPRFVHVCDAECAFRQLDAATEMEVCTVSGR